MNCLKKDKTYYFFLSIILLFGLILFILSNNNKSLQFWIFSSTVFSYVVLGIFHHFLKHDLDTKIVVEYLLIGGLGFSLFLFLIKGAISL